MLYEAIPWQSNEVNVRMHPYRDESSTILSECSGDQSCADSKHVVVFTSLAPSIVHGIANNVRAEERVRIHLKGVGVLRGK